MEAESSDHAEAPGRAAAVGQIRERRVALFATVFAMVLGSGIAILLHECAHWVTGAALGHPSRLYASFVTHAGSPSATDTAIMALSGPLLSLLLGLVLTFWLPLRRIGGPWHLLWVWTGFTSLQEAVTYLVITPFGVGDTATVLEALGGSAVIALILMAVGIAGMFWQARRFAVHVRRWSGDDLVLARCYAWFPWLLAAGWSVLLQIVMIPLSTEPTAAESILIALAGLSMTVFAPMSFIFRRRVRVPREPLELTGIPVVLVVGYLALLMVNIVLTVTGPPLG